MPLADADCVYPVNWYIRPLLSGSQCGPVRGRCAGSALGDDIAVNMNAGEGPCQGYAYRSVMFLLC